MPQGQYKLTDAKPIGEFSLSDAQPVSSAPAQPTNTLADAWAEFWKRGNPIEWAKGLIASAKAPMDGSLSGYVPNAIKLIEADPKFLDEAKAEAGNGNYLKAGRKVLSFISMGLGHDLDSQADMWEKGDYLPAAGAALGTAAAFEGPSAIGEAVGAIAPSVSKISALTPEQAAAVKAGQDAGVPIDAAAATGNKFVGAVQHVADRTLGGSVVAGRARAAQAQGLATMGEQLATKGYASPVTAEAAGEAVQGAVRGNIAKHRGAANVAYDKLREIEADPANTRTIPIEPKPGTSGAAEGAPADYTNRFARPGANTEDLWQGVLGDARRNGFKGSADDLKAEYTARLKSGREALKDAADTTSDVSGEELLTDIRRLGGLSDKNGAWSDINEFDPSFRSTVKRKGGLGMDDMVAQLRQEPKWAGLIPEDGAGWLQDFLFKASRGLHGKRAAASGELERALQIQGIEPGAKWWSSASEPTKSVQLAVDIRPAKAALQPMYDEMMQAAQISPPFGAKGQALTTLHKLMTGPDQASLSVVDSALSDLKRLARPDGMGMRSAGQGAAAKAVGELDQWVKMTAESAGPEALEALETGRAATIAKYAAADVLKSLYKGGKPVKAYGKLTSAGDANLDTLQAVAKQAPAELPKVGRAVLDGLLEKATANGGFEHGAAIAAKWEKLGPETKRLLFKDPGYVAELDNFFRLARMTAENANPSGTAHALIAGGQIAHAVTSPLTAVASQIGYASVSKFLHSAAGVRLLTEGIKLPKSAAAAQMWLSRVQKFAAAQGITLAQSAPATTEAR